MSPDPNPETAERPPDPLRPNAARQRRAWQATRLAIFFVAGGGLLLLAIVLGSGSRWWAANDRAVLHFEGSLQGLPVGAPVVFRGVRIGEVAAIGFAAQARGSIALPVVVSLQQDRLLALARAAADAGGGVPGGGIPASDALSMLISRGLVGRLSQQSLLTGQMLIELDLREAAAATERQTADAVGLPRIPTRMHPLQRAQEQLADLDLATMAADLALLARSARQLLGGPLPTQALEQVVRSAQSLERSAAALQSEGRQVSRAAQDTLGEVSRTARGWEQGAAAWAQAGDRIGESATALGQTARSGQELIHSAQPILERIGAAADQVERLAQTTQRLAADGQETRQQAEQTLQDIRGAAKALRELAEYLERHPDALLRGRR
jgi:paraquat-inducible protein B